MPPIDRAANRDVHIYDAQKPTEKELGGLILTIGVTNKDFYEMIDIIIIIHGTYVLRYNSSDTGASEVPKDDTPLQPGNYFIASAGKFLAMILLQFSS